MQSTCAVLPNAACLTLTTFLHIISSHGVRNNVTEHKMCVLIFSTTFVGNISLSKQNSARYHTCKVSVIITVRFNIT